MRRKIAGSASFRFVGHGRRESRAFHQGKTLFFMLGDERFMPLFLSREEGFAAEKWDSQRHGRWTDGRRGGNAGKLAAAVVAGAGVDRTSLREEVPES